MTDWPDGPADPADPDSVGSPGFSPAGAGEPQRLERLDARPPSGPSSPGRGRSAGSPRDRFVTVYGRMPVLEALLDDALLVDKVVLARSAHGPSVDDIVHAAARRAVRLERADATWVTRLSRNGRQDQGVVADVVAPGLADLDAWVDGRPVPLDVVVLDGVTNPANVGLVLRVATAAGMAVALPRQGSPDLGPLVVKASAGVAFRATVLRCPTAADACRSLAAAGWSLVGLDARASTSIWEPLPRPVALVLGGETAGASPAVEALVADRRSIPLDAGVESLNVATATAVAAFELRRQRQAGPIPELPGEAVRPATGTPGRSGGGGRGGRPA